jgi:transcriptional regulator with XRE-family HTH domain
MARQRQEETIGARIRRLREERGMTQRQLAEPGVSYAYLSRIEAGHREPSLRAMRIIARKLGVSLEYIETGARLPFAVERELRLSDAELELRLNRDLAAGEKVFLREAARGDEPALEARARAGLGLIAAQRSDQRAAIRDLEAATRSGYFPAETRPDLYRALGVAYVSVGMAHEAGLVRALPRAAARNVSRTT